MAIRPSDSFPMRSTSRLIVKNLPKSITENRLKTEFGGDEVVTDVKLKYTPGGKFRQFAFIGFKNEQLAEKTLKMKNQTYLYNSKILVEYCKNIQEATESICEKKANFEAKQAKRRERTKRIFAMMKKNKRKKLLEEERKAKKLGKLKNDNEEKEEIEKKATNEKKKDSDNEFKTIAQEAEEIDNGRIFIRNLYYNCTEDDLRELFTPFGEITELYLPFDQETKKIKGFAFVTFMFTEHAVKAFKALSGSSFQGRQLHLLPAKDKPKDVHHENHQNREHKSSYQREKEEKDKKNDKNWNPYIIGANAVTDIMSEKFKVDKKELLLTKGTNESIATRLALGETQVINETKQFFVDAGISSESVDLKNFGRSKNVILVKNLPANSDQNEVKELFAKWGEVKQVLVAPNGITAIVEMAEKAQAEAAFKNLYNKKFKRQPMFLEWAPVVKGKKQENKKQKKSELIEEEEEKEEDEKSDGEDEKRTKIMVRNIPFEANVNEVRELFAAFGVIKSIRLPQKSVGETHRGFGFIEYTSHTDAKKALEALSISTHLYGRRLVLEWATIDTDDEDFKKMANKAKKQLEANQRSTKKLKKGDLIRELEKEK